MFFFSAEKTLDNVVSNKQQTFLNLLKRIPKIEEDVKTICRYCDDWYKDPVIGFPCLECCDEY